MKQTKKRIFIHAGPGKTGSSSVQKWLLDNNDLLTSRKILYPAHTTDRNGVSSGNVLSIMSKAGSQLKIDSDKTKLLLDEFHSSEYSTLLLSSEFFFNQIEKLHKLIPEAYFIIYLRRYCETLESNYNQSIKRHKEKNYLGIPSNPNPGLMNKISQLLKVIEKDKIKLRSYHQPNIERGLIEDLVCCIDPHFNFKNSTNQTYVNNSYTLDALEYKRHANIFISADTDNQLDIALQALKDGLRDYTFLAPEKVFQFDEFFVRRLKEFNNICTVSGLEFILNHDFNNKRKQYVNQKEYLFNSRLITQHLNKNHKILYRQIKKELIAYNRKFHEKMTGRRSYF